MKTLLFPLATLALLTLAGCGMSTQGTGAIAKAPIVVTAKQTGVLHGGQQPVVGAHIQLYAVGNTGLQSASTALISSNVTTLGDGSFDITSLWNCNDTATYGTDPLLYLVATQGNPGLGPGVNNPAIAAMAALGHCSAVTASTFISVNELTTVAATYALAPFMSDYTHIGAPASRMIGLVNAFGTVATLVDNGTGTSPGPALPTAAAAPLAELDTLANVLATCINSNGGTPCASLFSLTQAPGGATPTETIGAMLQIVHQPRQNVAAIYNLPNAAVPFQPTLPSAPTDWSLAITFHGGSLSAPTGVAIDAAGNAWVANSGGAAVTELSPQGASTGADGYTAGGKIFGAQAVAIDRSGNVWLADSLLSSVIKITISGGIAQSSGSYTQAVNGPTGLAIDSQNNVWVANFGDGTVAELSSAGAPVGASPFTGDGSLQSPYAIALDPTGNVWVSDNSASILAKFSHAQTLLSGAGFTDQALYAPTGIAIDPQGRAWVAGNGSNGASLFTATGASAPASPFLGGGLAMPTSVAIDGAGTAWLTNGTSNGGLTRIVSATAAASGPFGTLNSAAGIAVDAGGNLWTANAGDDTVTKFIGIATPVLTPAAANVGP